MKKNNLLFPHERFEDFCRRWKVMELALFGSALREDFADDSDVDVLVTFASDEHWSLFDMVRMENELREMFGRDVDLVEKKVIEQSDNWIRREAILESAEVVYAAG